MVVLIFGKDPVSELLKDKFISNGETVLLTDKIESAREFLKKENRLELLVLGESASDQMVVSGGDAEEIEACYYSYAAMPLKMVQIALPYLEKGERKRICYLNTVLASNNQCYGTDHYAIRMAGAARNMQANILFNRLRPLGYTLRMFGCDRLISDRMQAESAFTYFLENRSIDENPRHEDENRFVMRDCNGREVPW